MRHTKRLIAWGVTIIGILLMGSTTFLQGSIPDEALLPLVTIAGMVILIGIMWRERINRIQGLVDERTEEIHYRAGWYTFWIVILSIWIMVTTALVPTWVIGAVVFWGIGIYFGFVWWFNQRM